VAWALLFLLLLLKRQGRLRELHETLRPGRTLAMLAASTALLAVNWLIYIWAVVGGRVLEASLGYFINPLVNVLLGVLVLKENLERPVAAAVALAGAGVLWLTLGVGHPPWISLALAASFGSYGLLRKLCPVGAVVGLAVETLLLFPLALAYLAWAEGRGELVFLRDDRGLDTLLVLAGPLTAVPLLLFAAAARRLPLSTLGFLQYLSPTVQFLLAVFVFGEPLGEGRLLAFVCIWAGLVLFAFHSLRQGAAEPLTEG
jgi:chloramphenicol-sensitive protein RarD